MAERNIVLTLHPLFGTVFSHPASRDFAKRQDGGNDREFLVTTRTLVIEVCFELDWKSVR